MRGSFETFGGGGGAAGFRQFVLDNPPGGSYYLAHD